MKTILLVISLIFFYAIAFGQDIYYGGTVSVSIEKYNSKSKEVKTGVNDIVVSVPVGYANKWFIAEITPACTASFLPSIGVLTGARIQLGDNAGIHFLGGYRDEMFIDFKNWCMRNYPHPTGTIRLWIGTFTIESKYVFRKEIYGGNSFEFGIGVIGF